MIAAITGVFEGFLSSLDIQVTAYDFLFPPAIDQAKIALMIKEKVFPTVKGLAPALTYALLLSISRYILHYLLMKVCAYFTHDKRICSTSDMTSSPAVFCSRWRCGR